MRIVCPSFLTRHMVRFSRNRHQVSPSLDPAASTISAICRTHEVEVKFFCDERSRFGVQVMQIQSYEAGCCKCQLHRWRTAWLHAFLDFLCKPIFPAVRGQGGGVSRVFLVITFPPERRSCESPPVTCQSFQCTSKHQ